jgi:hypothetical protein
MLTIDGLSTGDTMQQTQQTTTVHPTAYQLFDNAIRSTQRPDSTMGDSTRCYLPLRVLIRLQLIDAEFVKQMPDRPNAV